MDQTVLREVWLSFELRSGSNRVCRFPNPNGLPACSLVLHARMSDGLLQEIISSFPFAQTQAFIQSRFLLGGLQLRINVTALPY